MKKFFLLIAATIIVLTLADISFAQYTIPVKPELAPFSGLKTDNVTGISGAATTLNIILEIIAGGLLYLAAPLAIFMIAFYGLRIKLSQENFEASKKGLIWAVVGLVLIILSVVIIRTIIKVVISADDPTIQNQVEEASENQSNSSSFDDIDKDLFYNKEPASAYDGLSLSDGEGLSSSSSNEGASPDPEAMQKYFDGIIPSQIPDLEF